jgi:hypothetical protein
MKIEEMLSSKQINFRPALREDAPRWLDFLCKLDADTDYMLFEPGERDLSVVKCEQAIRRITDVRGAMLVLVEDATGDIVGHFKGDVLALERKSHVMSLSCALLKTHRGDTGRVLLRHFFDEVERQGVIRRIEGSVMANNVRMLLVGLSLGVVIEGLKRNSIQVNGQLIDEYAVAKFF